MSSRIRWKLFSSAMMMSLFVRSSGMTFETETSNRLRGAARCAGAARGLRPGRAGGRGREHGASPPAAARAALLRLEDLVHLVGDVLRGRELTCTIRTSSPPRPIDRLDEPLDAPHVERRCR